MEQVGPIERAWSPWVEPKPSGPPPRLTRRELEVLRLVTAGDTDKEIAAALFISRRTASHHVANILHKLGMETRRSARRWALREGFFAAPTAMTPAD